PDNGGYFLSADDAEGLVVRPSSTTDDATPNPNAVSAQNLVRLAVLTGDDTWRHRVDALFDGLVPVAGASLFGHMALLNALDFRLGGAGRVETGPGAAAATLNAAALKLPFLDRMVLRAAHPDALPPAHPARDKLAAAREPAVFVCVGERCSLPVADPQ